MKYVFDINLICDGVTNVNDTNLNTPSFVFNKNNTQIKIVDEGDYYGWKSWVWMKEIGVDEGEKC